MADAIDLDELCGPLGGADVTPSATFRTPSDAQRLVPQWQRQLASDVLIDEENELRRLDGMLPWHPAQSLTEKSQKMACRVAQANGGGQGCCSHQRRGLLSHWACSH